MSIPSRHPAFRAILAGGFCLALVARATWAAPAIPSGEQAWYYTIGGADPVSIVLNPSGASNRITGHYSLSLSYSCGDFDIVTSVKNAFTNVVSNVKNAVMTTAKGAIASLPLYIFQRALPGLYELFQTYSADFELDFSNAVMTCEDFEREILAGNDPYQKWIETAKGMTWRYEAKFNPDPVDAKNFADNNGGDTGLPFPKVDRGASIHAGGKGQDPIRAIYDVAAAGWNATLGRNPSSNAPYAPPPGVDVRLAELFPRPQDAGNYAVDVLGDVEVRTCQGCDRVTTPGNGLGPKFEAHRKNVAADLAALVSGTGTPSVSDLQKVSAPGVAISGRVIESLRLMPQEERAILAGRLASEVAIARTIEEAFAIRRMLIAGKRVPEVESLQPALETAERAVAEIEQEIDSFLFEQRVSKEIASNSASAILARLNQLNTESQSVIRQKRPEKSHLDTHGRIKK